MMRFLAKLRFCLELRLRQASRVSFGAYLKGLMQIRIGRRCKVHRDASLDASREGFIHLGDGVTINRFAYLQGDKGGVRLGKRVEINHFTIVNGTGGQIGDNALIAPGVMIGDKSVVGTGAVVT